MERREIDEEKKKEVQAFTARATIGMIIVVGLYLAYGILTKNLNILIFEILLGIFILGSTALTDVVEPKRLGMLDQMTIGQRSGYQKILLMDLVGVAALLYWLLGMNSEDGSTSILPIVIYFLAMQMKRKFRPEFEGTVDDAEPEQTEEQKKDE